MIYYLSSLFAITCYASLTVIAKKLQGDIPPFAFIGLTMTFLTLMAGAASFLFEKNFTLSSINTSAWFTLFGFAAINLAGFAIMLFAISKIPIVEYQIIAVITPIIGGLLAYFILSEGLSAKYFIRKSN